MLSFFVYTNCKMPYLAGHYVEIVTGHYFSIVPAAVCWMQWDFLRKSQHMNIQELSKQPNVFQQWRGLG